MSLVNDLGRAVDDMHGYVEVVDAEASPDDTAAVALVILNPGEQPWARATFFARDPDDGGAWYELFQADAEPGELVVENGRWWVTVACGRARPRVTHVTAAYGEVSRTRAVRDGWYLIPFWLDVGGPRPGAATVLD